MSSKRIKKRSKDQMSTRGQETNDDQVDPSTKLSTSKDSQKSKKIPSRLGHRLKGEGKGNPLK